MKYRNLFLFLLLFLPLAFRADGKTLSLRHQFHTSLTRMDYNPKDKIIECSVQLFTHDLVPVLESKFGKHIDLIKTTDVDKLIYDYLSENFRLTDEKGAVNTYKMIGKELDVDTVWVYLEIPAEKSPENLSLQNTIFFESFPEQTNLVTARFDGKKIDLLYRVGDRIKALKAPKETAEN